MNYNFDKPDEKVIIQPPVYYPFRLTPQGNEREVVFNPLSRVEGGSYEERMVRFMRLRHD